MNEEKFYRVAISDPERGYVYVSRTEMDAYADYTVGYFRDLQEAFEAAFEAAIEEDLELTVTTEDIENAGLETRQVAKYRSDWSWTESDHRSRELSLLREHGPGFVRSLPGNPHSAYWGYFVIEQPTC